MKPLYTAVAENRGGRDGRATGADGRPDLLIKPPEEMGGPADQPDATNPEELFALGYGACFLSALSLAARRQKLSAKEFSIDWRVTLSEEDGDFGLAVELHGTLPEVDAETAAGLMHAAHVVAPTPRRRGATSRSRSSSVTTASDAHARGSRDDGRRREAAVEFGADPALEL